MGTIQQIMINYIVFENEYLIYYDFVKLNYDLDYDTASELINEAFLYLKLKEGTDIDPLTKGDQFGAGFS